MCFRHSKMTQAVASSMLALSLLFTITSAGNENMLVQRFLELDLSDAIHNVDNALMFFQKHEKLRADFTSENTFYDNNVLEDLRKLIMNEFAGNKSPYSYFKDMQRDGEEILDQYKEDPDMFRNWSNYQKKKHPSVKKAQAFKHALKNLQTILKWDLLNIRDVEVVLIDDHVRWPNSRFGYGTMPKGQKVTIMSEVDPKDQKRMIHCQWWDSGIRQWCSCDIPRANLELVEKEKPQEYGLMCVLGLLNKIGSKLSTDAETLKAEFEKREKPDGPNEVFLFLFEKGILTPQVVNDILTYKPWKAFEGDSAN